MLGAVVAALLSLPLLLSTMACAVSAPAPPPVSPSAPQVVFDQRSQYERVIVVDEGGRRFLRFGSVEGDDQSVISLTDPKAVPMDYIRAGALGLLLAERVERSLMIGLGGGTFTTMLRRLLPQVSIDAVEIDPMVADVARRFFGVREDARFHIHVCDGVDFLTDHRQPYDLIFLDAYGADTVPQPMTTRVFFETVRERLTARGILVVNISVKEAIEEMLVDRLVSVFPDNACLRTPDDSNLVFFAGREPFAVEGTGQIDLTDRARDLPVDLVGIVERFHRPCRSDLQPSSRHRLPNPVSISLVAATRAAPTRPGSPAP